MAGNELLRVAGWELTKRTADYLKQICGWSWQNAIWVAIIGFAWEYYKEERERAVRRGDWVLWGQTTWDVLEWTGDKVLELMVIAAISGAVFEGAGDKAYSASVDFAKGVADAAYADQADIMGIAGEAFYDWWQAGSQGVDPAIPLEWMLYGAP